MAQEQENKAPRRQLDSELDVLEAKIAELRVLYEQYFVELQPLAPEKLQKEVIKLIRQLLRAPFKTSAIRFRLRTLVNRYQTYATYWERVMKQKEDGTYSRDVFRAELRDKEKELAQREAKGSQAAERGFKQLFDSYEAAMRKAGKDTKQLNFQAFKTSLMKKAKQLREQTGAKKLQYKVVVKDGKVVVKASAK